MNTDQNGRQVTKSVRRENDGTWGATVWSGSGVVTDLGRYYYRTREHARRADISNNIGEYGRVR